MKNQELGLDKFAMPELKRDILGVLREKTQ